MIPKSMSRKTASFDQLIAYMDSEKSDAHFDLHHNCYARGQRNLAGEFFENSKKLKVRKNGNILYHEIVSITLEDGVEVRYAKECLREIALKYIQDRCPRNMVYGCLHEDHKDHLHYHLLISANERGEQKRFWHTTSQFDQIKRDLEEFVLAKYPKLKQRRIVTADTQEKKQSKKAAEMKRQKKKLSVRDEVRNTILKAMMHTTSLDEFHANLARAGYEYYARGKHHGVTVSEKDGYVKKYRFATIGVHECFEEYLGVMQGFAQAEAEPAPEPQSDHDASEQTETSDRSRDPLSQDDRGTEDVAGEKENEGKGAAQEHEVDQAAKDTQSQQPDQTPEPEIEAPDFLQELQDRRARRNEKKAAKSAKRKGKPRR